MTATQIMAHRLTKSYAGLAVVDQVDLLVQGGITTILGPNGAGKTTLLRMLATVTVPESGSLLIDGLNPDHESDRIEVRRRLGYMPQAHGLTQDSRVFDLLDYVAVLKKLGDERRRRHLIFEVLELVGLADRSKDRASKLSGGMQQRLGLAQSLLGSPSLLILDEPAAGLDPQERLRLRSIVSARRNKATVVLSTHLTEEATISDTILVMTEGRLVFIGTPLGLSQNASGRTWIQNGAPSGIDPNIVSSWMLPDGRHRCLGSPPPGVEAVEPTIEDGYLLLQRAAAPL